MLKDVISNFLINSKHSSLDQVKIKFGVQVILSELYKLSIIYGMAVLFNCFLETFITHLTFYILRQISFGYHLPNNLSCIIWSVISFPMSTIVLSLVYLDPLIIWSIMLLSLTVIFIYAPVGTQKHKILNVMHRKYLRKKLYIRLPIIICCLYFSPLYIQKFIVLGVFIQCIFLVIQLCKEKGIFK